MEEIPVPPPECTHKFKVDEDGMLTCKLCGFRQAPHKQEPAGPPGAQPIYDDSNLDTSAGAKRIKSQGRWGRVTDVISNIIDFITWW